MALCALFVVRTQIRTVCNLAGLSKSTSGVEMCLPCTHTIRVL
jgi:hypothetical protein